MVGADRHIPFIQHIQGTLMTVRETHLFLLAALLISLPACSSGWNHTSVRGTWDHASGDVYAETVRPGVVGVAAWRDGRLLGADALDQNSRWDWLKRSNELVDHPSLPAWREQIVRLDAAVAAPDVDASSVLAAARSLPFRSLISDRMQEWVGQDAGRAAAMLDVVDEIDVNDATAAHFVTLAVAAPGADDQRLTVWALHDDVIESAAAAKALATAPGAGPHVWRALVDGIDDVPHSSRKDVFVVAARGLVVDGSQARLLVRRLDELPTSDRRPTALSLLEVKGASPELAIRILDDIDDFYGNDRPAIFIAAASAARAHPRAQRLMSARLDELYGNDRTRCALTMLSWPECVETVAGDVVKRIDDFYGNDREQVLLAVIDGAGYIGSTQRACIRAARSELYRSARRRVLAHIIELSATTAENRARARRALDD